MVNKKKVANMKATPQTNRKPTKVAAKKAQEESFLSSSPNATPGSQKEYVQQQMAAAIKKKPAKTRAQILSRFHNVYSLAGLDPKISDNLSGNYGTINTTELVIWLCAKKGYKVISEAEQVARRNWKKYNSDAAYKKEIDDKQRMAKHCVLLSNEKNDGEKPGYPKDHEIIIMNSYKGNMALKLYMGYFSQGSASLYRVYFNTIEEFQSLRHTWNNAHSIHEKITEALKDLKKNRKEESKKLDQVMNHVLISEQLDIFLLTMQEDGQRFPQYKVDMLKKYVRGNDADQSLLWLKNTIMNMLINSANNSDRTPAIGTLDKRAKTAIRITEYFNAL